VGDNILLLLVELAVSLSASAKILHRKLLVFISVSRQAVAHCAHQGTAAARGAVWQVNGKHNGRADNLQRTTSNRENAQATCIQTASNRQRNHSEPVVNPQGTSTRLVRMDSQRPHWYARVSRGQAREFAQARSGGCVCRRAMQAPGSFRRIPCNWALPIDGQSDYSVCRVEALCLAVETPSWQAES
jgi:hypothetical protein